MSDCDVCIGGSGGYDIEDYSLSMATSKRNWKCCECDRIIPAGTEYEKVTGSNADDGDAVLFRTCMDCSHIAEGLSCDRRIHTTLWNDLEENGGFENFSEACVAKVKTVSAKTYLVGRWLKWKGLAGERPDSGPSSTIKRVANTIDSNHD